MKSLLTKKEVAAALQVSEQTVAKLVKSGALGAAKVGGQIRFTERDVQDYLQRQHEELHYQELRKKANG